MNALHHQQARAPQAEAQLQELPQTFRSSLCIHDPPVQSPDLPSPRQGDPQAYRRCDWGILHCLTFERLSCRAISMQRTLFHLSRTGYR